MPESITDYYLAEFASPSDAEAVARQLGDFLAKHRNGWREGALRAVVWTGSPLAAKGALYLSVGALDAAAAAGLTIKPSRRVPTEELPAHRSLLIGDRSADRSQT
jgi:hypothetical protein